MTKETMNNVFGISDRDLEIIHCIFHIRKELDAQMHKDLEASDLSNAQIELLACARYGEIDTSTELAAKLRVSKSNLTGLITRLEEKGLLTRKVSAEDARSKLIKVTKKGEKLIDKIVPEFLHFLSSTMSGVPDKEKEFLEKNLKLILTSLEKRNEVIN